MLTAAVITVSDKGSQGLREDKSGPAVAEILKDKGYDVVYAYYEEIKQTVFRKFGSWMAAKMSEIMLGAQKGSRGSSFYVARRFVIDEMIRYDNAYPYLGGLVLRTTHNISSVMTHHRERLSGTSGYSFIRLLKLWINGFTAFSVMPLRVGVFTGAFFSVVGILFAISVIIKKKFKERVC